EIKRARWDSNPGSPAPKASSELKIPMREWRMLRIGEYLKVSEIICLLIGNWERELLKDIS
ncbi:MAG: hypothetical protein ACUVQ9_13670, partial [Thermodesulfobacteriota bacterium]